MANTLMYLAEKCGLLLHFGSKNINVFENTLAPAVNEFVSNKLIKLTIL